MKIKSFNKNLTKKPMKSRDISLFTALSFHFYLFKLSGALILFLTLLSPNAKAADTYAGAASYLQFGAGASVMGMGSAFTAAEDDCNSIYFNPAGIAGIKKSAIFVQKDNMQADRNLNIFTGVMPIFKGVAGISYMRYGVENILITELDTTKQINLDFQGNPVYDINTKGWFNDAQSTLSLSYAASLTNYLKMGINLKHYTHEAMESSADGWGFDAGFLLKLRDNFNIGFSLRDVGGELAWNTATSRKDKIPYQAALGLSWKWKKRIQAMLDIVSIQEKRAKINLGLEAKLAEAMLLRGGLKDGMMTAGIGLQVAKGSSIDAAWLDEEFGPSYRLSATITFDSFRKKSKSLKRKKTSIPQRTIETQKKIAAQTTVETEKTVAAQSPLQQKIVPVESSKKTFTGWLHYSGKSFKIKNCMLSGKKIDMIPLASLEKAGIIKSESSKGIISFKISTGSAIGTLVSLKPNDNNFLINNSKWIMLKAPATDFRGSLMIPGAELLKKLDSDTIFERVF